MNKIKTTPEQADLIKGFSSAINGEWYYIPYWFKDVGNGVFEIHRLGELPDELKQPLIEFRQGFDHKKQFDFPLFIDECNEN